MYQKNRLHDFHPLLFHLHHQECCQLYLPILRSNRIVYGFFSFSDDMWKMKIYWRVNKYQSPEMYRKWEHKNRFSHNVSAHEAHEQSHNKTHKYKRLTRFPMLDRMAPLSWFSERYLHVNKRPWFDTCLLKNRHFMRKSTSF